MRIALWVGAAFLVALTLMLINGWRAFGKNASGARRTRMESSPQWKDGHFENPEPLRNDAWGMITGLLHASPDVSPKVPLPVTKVRRAELEAEPESGLRVTWFGHSSIVLSIDGHRILTDPNWSERASPFSWIGPKRWYEAPIALRDLPPIEAVVVSHDHYDHLDAATMTAIAAMKDWGTKFVVPLGIGAHLEYWGISPERIVELDWWEQTRIGDLEIVCTPARHASGRFLRQNATLWGSYVFLGPKHRAYFSGDTGLFPVMKQIGERFGPFDVTMIEVGQYHASWPDWHIGPEQAVIAHKWLRGRVLFPMHWGLFPLAYHGWTEPMERVLVAASKHGADVAVAKPGQPIEPEHLPSREHWWPNVLWETAEKSPVVSTQVTVDGF